MPMAVKIWIGVLAAALAMTPAGAKRATVDAPAPPFRVTTVTKEKLDLPSLRGKVIVVNRWATWCQPCRAEFVLFDRYAAARAKYGFTVIAIEVGGAASSGPMRDLAKLVHFPVVLDYAAHADAYPVIDDGVPTNYVIDRAGIVRYAQSGEFTAEELDALIVPLLKEPAPAEPAADAAK